MGFKARSGARIAATSAVLALAIAAAPAHAALAPTLISATGQTGWSNNQREAAAAYDKLLADSSSATLKDGAGATVAGHATSTACVKNKDGSETCGRSKVLRFTSDQPLVASRAPFTVTFTATAASDATATTTSTFSFTLDTDVPKLPAIGTPAPMSQSGPDVTLSGVAADRVATDGAGSTDFSGTSGISGVQLRFYNPLKAFDPFRGGSTEVFHRDITVACSPTLCPASTTWTTSVKLDPGYWTVEAFAFDLAGNRSPDSQTVSFVVLPA